MSETQRDNLEGRDCVIATDAAELDGVGDLAREVKQLRAELEASEAARRRDQQAFDTLERSNTRLRRAFETSFMFKGFLDLDGILLDTNETSLAAVGVRLSDVVGKLFWELPWFTPAFGAPAKVRDLVRRGAAGETVRISLTEEWISGPRTFDLSVTPVHDQAGRPDVLMVEAFEVTALIAAEQKLHQTEKMSALGSLLAGVAHELNNPLSVVTTQAALLQETSADPRAVMRADKIVAAADRCARIVRSFLAIARQRPPTRERVALAGVVQAALDLTSYGLRSQGVEVSVDLAADLPAAFGDADQLSQVVMNLLVNAQHAMQTIAGPRRLAIEGVARDGQVILAFADNGPGVPPAIRSRIYDPFFTTKPTGTGTGIGLSLCQSIVQSHGGTLSYEETPGGGATFVLRLPPASLGEEREEDSLSAPEFGSNTRVLIADDEPEIVEALTEIVRPFAKQIDSAPNGSEALRLLRASRYDLVLSDLRMPELDGRALYAALSAFGTGQLPCVVFATGDLLDGELLRFLGETGLPIIEKPFTPAAARRIVADALQDWHVKQRGGHE